MPREFAEAQPVFPLPAEPVGRPPDVLLEILFPIGPQRADQGAVYALIALGLTLIYGVLHIINFAHGALLTVAMYARLPACARSSGIDPYVAALPIVVPGMFFAGLRGAARA